MNEEYFKAVDALIDNIKGTKIRYVVVPSGEDKELVTLDLEESADLASFQEYLKKNETNE